MDEGFYLLMFNADFRNSVKLSFLNRQTKASLLTLFQYCKLYGKAKKLKKKKKWSYKYSME